MLYSTSKLNQLNKEFNETSANGILEWVISHHRKVLATTNFGPHEAVLLHHISRIKPDLPIICVDHGYNTAETYRVAEELENRLKLNMYYYTPRVTRRRREVVFNGVPDISDTAEHRNFVQEVKLEPFFRAFAEHQPEIWLTAIRRNQTEFRASLDIFADDEKFNCLKVSPFFYWTELDMEEYLVENNLPIVEDYHDPTKVLAHRECGLHLQE